MLITSDKLVPEDQHHTIQKQLTQLHNNLSIQVTTQIHPIDLRAYRGGNLLRANICGQGLTEPIEIGRIIADYLLTDFVGYLFKFSVYKLP